MNYKEDGNLAALAVYERQLDEESAEQDEREKICQERWEEIHDSFLANGEEDLLLHLIDKATSKGNTRPLSDLIAAVKYPGGLGLDPYELLNDDSGSLLKPTEVFAELIAQVSKVDVIGIVARCAELAAIMRVGAATNISSSIAMVDTVPALGAAKALFEECETWALEYLDSNLTLEYHDDGDDGVDVEVVW